MQANAPKPIIVHSALFLVNVIYAASYTISKEVMPEFIGPSGFIVLRVLTALVLLFFYHTLLIKKKIANAKDYLKIAVCALFGVAINMLLFFEGLSLTSPINASLMMVTTPILVLLIAFISGLERISIIRLCGILSGAAGAAMLVLASGESIGDGDWKGDIMVLLNAASFGIYLVLVKPLMKRYHSVTIIFWSFVFGSFMVLPFGYNDLADTQWQTITSEAWLCIGFVTVFTTFIAYALNAWALQHVSASVVGSYIYLQPLLGTIIAIASGKYLLHWQQVIFAIMILTGVYMTSFRPRFVTKPDNH
ncbi:MAG: DMT family transporter [Bacteroidota bacterium]|nr:DMT family transporter [Bacteroidota bacterium]